MDVRHWVNQALEQHQLWRDQFGPVPTVEALTVSDEAMTAAFAAYTERMQDNYPFFHPRWVGQMLKPPHPAAVTGYLAAMLINPNNHSRDAGPATEEMELEIMGQLATMFGFEQPLGHLTTSGTIANLEALFVARQLHPDLGIAYSEDAHYTHERMCRLLGVQGYPIPTRMGTIDLDAVAQLAAAKKIGTVVLTAGSTGLGTVDRIDQALELKERYGLRIHVDAAYGGFFALLGRDEELARELDMVPEPWLALPQVDSIVVDPHKHGLQPYGCGAVLFRDAAAAVHFKHDSPYTYYTQSELHLGEISLECSRAGAAAAGLWLTMQVLPLTHDGLGAGLAASRRAALAWTQRLADDPLFALYQRPALDIVTYFPTAEPPVLSTVDAKTEAIVAAGMAAPADESLYLSVLTCSAGEFVKRHPEYAVDQEQVRILRSVLMKPEHEAWVEPTFTMLHDFARSSTNAAPPADAPAANL